MNYTQRLLDAMFPFVEDLLSKYGEFFPLAAAVTAEDSIASVGSYEGDEQSPSDQLISTLKNGIKALQHNYKSVAIFYDVRVLVPATKLTSDAVAVFAETRYQERAYIIFYPYVLTHGKLVDWTGGPWKQTTEKEIFID